MGSRATRAVIGVTDLDVVEVGGASSFTVEHKVMIGVCHGEVSVKIPNGGAIDPHLAMSRCRLIVLYLYTVPGVGTQYIGVAIQIIACACAIPEVDIQPVPARIVIDHPEVTIVDVLAHSDRGGTESRGEAEGEAGVGLRLGTADQRSGDGDKLAAGVRERRRVGATIDN